MMKSYFFFLLLTALTLLIHAQENFYRSKQNPYYWGNRKPDAAYWQQDVHYRIKADINEKTDVISGHMQLTYWNNSPDTIYEVFFHLYENAFQPGSYYDDLHRNNKVKPQYGKYEKQGLGTVVLSFRHEEDEEPEQELDNTIMRVKLRKPILPGTSTWFELDFKTYFDSGSIRRRNKVFNSYGYKHYDGTHWYPIICVYDSKFKWTTDQHLGREFYANFGTFDVELTFAAHFIVEATGVLINRDEVLPDTLRKKLDISNFKDKPLESKPSVIIPYDSTQRKTWKYHAENVHNFAFTADPTYRIGEAYTKDGVQCIALVQEPHAANWIPVADYTVKVLELFSRDFGQYAYPKMVVADARDGMEYPMLTLCGGLYPGNKALIAHEVGHNWFYGMVGSNETYRAMLDEGFTQFLTVWALDNIPDENKSVTNQSKRKKWKERFRLTLPARDTRAYLGYLIDAIRYDDMPLNTHSDMFQGALRQGGGYRHVYTKTATMLYNLQYVLGDTLFQNAMKYYFNKWKMAHPYPQDFRQSIIEYTQTDLNWFFDQWMETTKTIDYKVKRVSKNKMQRKKTDHEKFSKIIFQRKGEMQMPVDFTVILKNGDSLNYHIPNTWFEKKGTATVLPRWIGWQKLKPTYSAAIQVNDKIKNVIIDPTFRLADINMMNNAIRPEIQWHWDAQVYHPPDWRRYHIYTRPELWWNAIDGFKAGWHFNGNYMQYRHQFALSFWIPTGLAHGNARQYRFLNEQFKPIHAASFRDVFNYRFTYETGLNKVIKGLSVFLTSGYQEGMIFCRTGFTQKIRNSNISVYTKLINRPRHNKNLYVLNGLWLTEKINNSLNVEWNHRYQYDKGHGKVSIHIRNTSLAAAYDYTYAEAEKINISRLWRFELRSRLYVRYGWGNKIPLESALDITGANNEALMEFPLLRSRGFVPPQLIYDKVNSLAHFQQGGGLNLRAFADMFITSINTSQNTTTYHSLALSGGAINLELDIDGLATWQPKLIRDYLHLDVYLFFDAGITPSDIKIRNGNGLYTFANDGIFTGTDGKVFANGGIGFAVTLKKFGALEKIKPFTLRCDLPWWATSDLFSLSRTEMNYRFMFGLYRSF